MQSTIVTKIGGKNMAEGNWFLGRDKFSNWGCISCLVKAVPEMVMGGVIVKSILTSLESDR